MEHMTEDNIYKLVEQVKRSTGLPARFNPKKKVVEVYRNGEWISQSILTEG